MVVGVLLTCILLEEHDYLSKLEVYYLLIHALGFDLPGAHLTNFGCDRSMLIGHVMMVLVLQII